MKGEEREKSGDCPGRGKKGKSGLSSQFGDDIDGRMHSFLLWHSVCFCLSVCLNYFTTSLVMFSLSVSILESATPYAERRLSS